MVKFGKYLQTVQRLDWVQYYLDYGKFKKMIKYKTDCPQAMISPFIDAMDLETAKITQFYISLCLDLTESVLTLEKLTFSNVHIDRLEIASGFRRICKKFSAILEFSELNLLGICKALKKMQKHVPSPTPLAYDYLDSRMNIKNSPLNQLKNYQDLEHNLSKLHEVLHYLDKSEPKPSSTSLFTPLITEPLGLKLLKLSKLLNTVENEVNKSN